MRRTKIYSNGMTFIEMAYSTANLRSDNNDEDRLMSYEEYYEYCAEVQIIKTVVRRNRHQEYQEKDLKKILSETLE